MDPDELAGAMDGIVHADTQVHERGVDLTVAAVHEITAPGRVDFGGGELEPAGTRPHEKIWRDVEDDYRWWHLRGGTYLLEYNESVALEQAHRLQPRRAMLERGAHHPSVSVRELGRIPLTVPDDGLRIKENARVSTLLAE
ncbi:dCTP deaminase [Halobacteriales archaeon QS_8_69_26]|nr:MAG: dCTP deaminase [Halobacteriales archaeon QS_8_69_26]